MVPFAAQTADQRRPLAPHVNTLSVSGRTPLLTTLIPVPGLTANDTADDVHNMYPPPLSGWSYMTAVPPLSAEKARREVWLAA